MSDEAVWVAAVQALDLHVHGDDDVFWRRMGSMSPGTRTWEGGRFGPQQEISPDGEEGTKSTGPLEGQLMGTNALDLMVPRIPRVSHRKDA